MKKKLKKWCEAVMIRVGRWYGKFLCRRYRTQVRAIAKVLAELDMKAVASANERCKFYVAVSHGLMFSMSVRLFQDVLLEVECQHCHVKKSTTFLWKEVNAANLMESIVSDALKLSLLTTHEQGSASASTLH